jgi:thioredoxin 1
MFRKVLLSAGLVLSIAGNASAQIRVVSDFTFYREVIQSERPVLVDFTASWCAPCREMAPRLEQLAAEHSAVKVVQVDIDASPGLAERFGVEAIPTMMVFFRGARVAVTTGAMSYTRLDRFLHDAVDEALRGTSLVSSHSPAGANRAHPSDASPRAALPIAWASRGRTVNERRAALEPAING